MIRRAVRKRSPITCVAGSMPGSRSVEDPARDGKSKLYTNHSSKDRVVWYACLAERKQGGFRNGVPLPSSRAMSSARSFGGTRLATAWKVLVPEACRVFVEA
jgi:hypothetical protein